MKLIDADLLIKDLLEQIPLAENVPIFKEIIESQPTAYDVDKVVEQIKGARDEDGCIVYVDDESAIQKNIVIQIVKAGSKE